MRATARRYTTTRSHLLEWTYPISLIVALLSVILPR